MFRKAYGVLRPAKVAVIKLVLELQAKQRFYPERFRELASIKLYPELCKLVALGVESK